MHSPDVLPRKMSKRRRNDTEAGRSKRSGEGNDLPRNPVLEEVKWRLFNINKGDIVIQFNPIFLIYGEKKLAEIASQTIEMNAVWKVGDCNANIGVYAGINYVSFFMFVTEGRNAGKTVVILDTQESIEKRMGVKLRDLIVKGPISDGSHRHGHENGPTVV